MNNNYAIRRANHLSQGDPCIKCGKIARLHIKHHARKPYKKRFRPIIGIDGEGKDLPDGRHIYTLLCAVDETGRIVSEVENQNGLSTLECLDMLLRVPRNSLKVVFMGSYDWTKIIEGLPLLEIYQIMHPETRRRQFCTRCKQSVHNEPCHPGAKIRSILNLQRVELNRRVLYLDWFNGSFTVAEGKLKRRFKRRTKVWDVFKFFQCSFVKALENWKIGTDEQRARILAMKEKRGSFAEESSDNIRNYCREECWLLAKMMREVINACKAANIELTRFEGAGSIAGALLKREKVKQYIDEPVIPNLQRAIMSAYFGGRFENSVVGAITRPVHARDIYSAYPYALFMLPCLVCGSWRYVRRNIMTYARRSTLALIRFRVASVEKRKSLAWAPFPCRAKDGICYPTGFYGWSWLPEFEPGLAGWPDIVEPLGAWLYESNCDHEPFSWVPNAYRQRHEWGKDGRGIVMKLGLNACAGKTMQNEGDPPPYKSWIWGGMITAITRGQALEGICAAHDPWKVLAIATDGLFTTEVIDLPKPERLTGTEDLPKPLGHWGNELYENGVFFVKPGLYFDGASQLMRARGIGRRELTSSREKLVEAFRKWDRRTELKVRVKSRRFFGARSSILAFSGCSNCQKTWPGMPGKLCPSCEQVGDEVRTTTMRLKNTEIAAYGRWAERDIDIEFDCHPKRERIAKGGSYGRMYVRDMKGIESVPYEPGKTTPQGLMAKLVRDEVMEMPDWEESDI